MSKWYVGLDGEEMVNEFKAMADKVQAMVGNLDQWEREYDKLKLDKYNPARSACVDMKTEYYMHNKETYIYWENCKFELEEIVRNMYSEAVFIHTGRKI